VRFRQDWIIAENASSFFFTKDTSWTSLAEVRIPDKNGRSAGNIDIVLVSYDKNGKIIDFGSLEIQAVYITGNVRNPFEYYIENPDKRRGMDWSKKPNYPKPDFLSSSRKRLVPQMLYKGGIFKTWKKKQAVAIQKCFFDTLPKLPQVKPLDADIAWLLYDLELDSQLNVYNLKLQDVIYTDFKTTLDIITIAEPGDINDFMTMLQDKLDDKLENAPDAPTLIDVIRGE